MNNIDLQKYEFVGSTTKLFQFAQSGLDLNGSIIKDNIIQGPFGIAQIVATRHDPTFILSLYPNSQSKLYQQISRAIIIKSTKLNKKNNQSNVQAQAKKDNQKNQNEQIQAQQEAANNEQKNSDDFLYQDTPQQKQQQMKKDKKVKKKKRVDLRKQIKSKLAQLEKKTN